MKKTKTDSTASSCIRYNKDGLLNYIEGATLLAAGGGGAKQIAKALLDSSGIEQVSTISTAQLPPDVPIAMTAQVFAPSAISQNKDFRSALNSFTASIGRGAVLPVEVGAVNGIVPAIIASLTNSVLLTDSTSDRSVPEMNMTLFQNHVPLEKVCMVPKTGSPTYQHDFGCESDAMEAETYILKIMSEQSKVFQGVGGFAAYPMSALELQQCASQDLLFQNTFQYAITLGRVMASGQGLEKVMAVIKDYLSPNFLPYTLFTGYFSTAAQHPHAQDYGYADFRSADPDTILGLRIYYSNENMIAYATVRILKQGIPTAMELFPIAIGPDAIGYLLLEGESTKGYKAGFSFSNEAFDPVTGDPQFFQTNKIAIIGIPESRLRRPDIIGSFSREISKTRASFGLSYDGKYSPIEELPKLQSMLDITTDNTVNNRGEKERIQFCFTKPDQFTQAWINHPESGTIPLTSQPLMIPFSLIQGRRITVDGTLQNGKTGEINMQFPQSGYSLD